MPMYVICGITGEGHHRTTWQVVASDDKDLMEGLCQQMNDVLTELDLHNQMSDMEDWIHWRLKANVQPVRERLNDPQLHVDYTGVRYYLTSVRLIEEEPQF